MSDTFEVRHLDQRIASAWSALGSARAALHRSPNAERLAFADMAELTVNELLERRYELVTAERIVRA